MRDEPKGDNVYRDKFSGCDCLLAIGVLLLLIGAGMVEDSLSAALGIAFAVFLGMFILGAALDNIFECCARIRGRRLLGASSSTNGCKQADLSRVNPSTFALKQAERNRLVRACRGVRTR